MVLTSEKQLEQAVLFNDAQNISILGIEQGCILLFTANSTLLSRNASTQRTFIGGVQLTDGDQKIFYRHSTCVKITHASLNATRTLCCFVIRADTDPPNFDVFVAEIGSLNSTRLFSLKFSRPSPIKAYLTPHDAILLLYRDAVTVFRMPNTGRDLDRSTAVDRDAHLTQCIYYQWDTITQRLHVIQRRIPNLTTHRPIEGSEPLVYGSYVLNNRGQFDSIMTINFDHPLPDSSSGHSNFEIISSETSLYLCWQSTMKEETENVEYSIVSLGHGRTFRMKKPLNRDNWTIFRSRKVHFGLLADGYVFAFLRGEFIHILDFNVHSNFVNHLLLSDHSTSLPYETRYTTQRGLMDKTWTLIYEKKNLFTYTVRVNIEEFVRAITPSTIYSIIAYSIFGMKDNILLGQILEKILLDMTDDLKTKEYLEELLTALIFNRLDRKYHRSKHVLAFPSTTITSYHKTDNEVELSWLMHHREYIAENSRSTNIDKEYTDTLRTACELTRRYRKKLSVYHPMLSNDDELETNYDFSRNSPSPSPPNSFKRTESFSKFRFSFTKRNSFSSNTSNTKERDVESLDPKKKELYNNIHQDLQQLHPHWEERRSSELALHYVQSTEMECNVLITLFSRLARFDRTQPIADIPTPATAEKYQKLLTILEKLYLAMIELGFSPTTELQRTLTEVSFRVLPFDRFVASIDQNIFPLTEEFVERVVLELDDQPKSYAIKEQMILMLPNVNSEVHSRLFAYIKTNRAKRTAAQLVVARRFLSDKRTTTSPRFSAAAMFQDPMSDGLITGNESTSQSRLVEQAAVTFYRDCNQRGIFTDDDMSLVKSGLLALASPTL